VPPAPRWSLREAEAATASIDLHRAVGVPVDVPVVILDIAAGDDHDRWATVTGRLAPLPVVTVAASGSIADAVDLDVDGLAAAVIDRPHAATMAALLLRHLPAEPMAAFHLESAAYATLQAGPEHRAWLEQRGRRTRNDDHPRVRLDDGDPVTITLTRPRLHNLLDRRGRDELADAFRTVALLDPDTAVRWVAEGSSFCAGGDPADFGTVADPTSAHLVRATTSPARALAAIRDRVEVVIHGACVGAGIELAAQAGHVVAAHDAHFRLPELSMGVIPGVGGTWSISRRIGRQRLLTWLLLDLDVDAETAQHWGLVDSLMP
jgi:hypothetical protein